MKDIDYDVPSDDLILSMSKDIGLPKIRRNIKTLKSKLDTHQKAHDCNDQCTKAQGIKKDIYTYQRAIDLNTTK